MTTSPSDETKAHLEQQKRLARAWTLLRGVREYLERTSDIEDVEAIVLIAQIETELLGE